MSDTRHSSAHRASWPLFFGTSQPADLADTKLVALYNPGLLRHTVPPPAMSDHESTLPIYEDRLLKDDGWTARVIKNEDDEGWAVAMFKDGESEPALVGPWTMGRDKKNPKPLDANAFSTLVKTASEVLRRHEQQLHATLNKSVTITFNDAAVTVTLTIVPDDYEPHGMLKAIDEQGSEIASKRVEPNFILTRASAIAWADKGFSR